MGKLQLHKLKNRNSVVVKETALNIKNIEEFLPENGKTLILCSKRMSKTDIVKDLIKGSNELFIICDKVLPNPDVDQLDDLNIEYANKHVGLVICIGGGSIIDAGKALSLSLCKNRAKIFSDYFRGEVAIQWEKKIPCLVVPTTAGTGSEFTPFATIWDKIEKKKYSLENDLIFPNYILLDPLLTLSLPYELTLFCGLDALSHALESIWNKNADEISRTFSMNALKLIKENLPGLLNNLSDINHRRNMQYASSNAGIAISYTKTAIAHSISYPITAYHNVPHGLACSFTLSVILEQNLRSISRNKDESNLLHEVLSLLNQLDLRGLIGSYLTHNDLQLLTSQMINKDRANNFPYEYNLNDIISKSITTNRHDRNLK